MSTAQKLIHSKYQVYTIVEIPWAVGVGGAILVSVFRFMLEISSFF